VYLLQSSRIRQARVTPTKTGPYVFDAGTIRRLRERLDWSQAKLALELQIPINTVSRWESGATTPDARSLASIYSVAKANGQEISFFGRAEGVVTTVQQRTRAIVVWDYQNMGIRYGGFGETAEQLLRFIRSRYPGISIAHAVVFTDHMSGWQIRSEIQDAQFELDDSESGDRDSDIAELLLRLSAKKAGRTVVFLVSKDGDFATTIEQVRAKGAHVWVWGGGEESERLVRAVGRKYVIPSGHSN
jgi:transcriptional regulator with XRE-family HTH domain